MPQQTPQQRRREVLIREKLATPPDVSDTLAGSDIPNMPQNTSFVEPDGNPLIGDVEPGKGRGTGPSGWIE